MNLTSAIKYYQKTDLIKLREIERYYKNLSLEEAIKNAAEATDPNGNINSHQRRLGRLLLKRAAQSLIPFTQEIGKAKSFQDLFSVTEQIKNKTLGLGPLWSYDTASRIGFNRNIHPDQVYLQYGVVVGAKMAIKGNLPKGRSAAKSKFREELKILKAYEIENFLCCYPKY